MTDEVILVQPLHNDDDRASLLVVEPGQKRMVVPFVDGVAPGFRQGLVGLQWVIDDDQVGAAASGTAIPCRHCV